MKKLVLFLLLFVGCANDPPNMKSPTYILRNNSHYQNNAEFIQLNETNEYFIVQSIHWPYSKYVLLKTEFKLIPTSPCVEAN